MITITFEGSVADVMSEMEALVAAHGVSSFNTQPTEDAKPKPARAAAKKAGTAAAGPEAGSAAEGNASTEGATSSAGQSSAAGETPSREDIAKKAVLYGQPGKGGPVALKELLGKHGAPNQKWSEVPEENLPALNIELDELLA